jgi:hypothetical protein
MKQSIRLTESELINVIKRIINESNGKNLMEQVNPIVSDLTLTLNYSVDPTSKQKTYSQYITFSTPINVEDRQAGKSYMYEGVYAITFDLKEWESITPKKQTKSGKFITGEIRVSDNVLNFLKPYLNKGKSPDPIKIINLIPMIKNTEGQVVKSTASSGSVYLTVTEKQTGVPVGPKD